MGAEPISRVAIASHRTIDVPCAAGYQTTVGDIAGPGVVIGTGPPIAREVEGLLGVESSAEDEGREENWAKEFFLEKSRGSAVFGVRLEGREGRAP
jgi:hypothetical protein